MARRLITTLLSVAFALALATAALAANGDEAAPPSNEVPESESADRAIAAVDRAEASVERVRDALLRRLDGIERSSAAAHTESLRVIAVQKPDDTVPDTTDTGGDVPGPTAAPTTNTGTTTTTTAPPGGPTSTTTTTTAPPPTCDEPDEAAILAAFNQLDLDIADAATLAEATLDALQKQAIEDEAALEAALKAARTVADVNEAYADAATRLNAHYDGLIAAIEQFKNRITVAGERARARLRQACADDETVRNVLGGILDELEQWDKVIEGFGESRAADLAALEAEKAAFLEDFVPAADDNGGGNGNGNGNGGEDGDGNGNGDGSGQEGDGGSLPFAGANALPLLIAGLVLVGAGVATVVVTRRRKDGESTN